MYAPAPNGRFNIKVGQRFEPLSAFSDFEITHNPPEATPVDQPLDDGVEGQPAVLGKPTAGALNCTLTPPEIASPAFRELEAAFWAGNRVEAEAYLGKYALVVEQSAGANNATLAISAAGVLTLAEKGTGNTQIGASFGPSETNRAGNVIDRGHVLELAAGGDQVAFMVGPWLSTTTRRVYRIGVINSGVASYDDEAIPVVAATDVFKVHAYILRVNAMAQPTRAADISAASAGLSSSVGMQLSQAQGKQFWLKAFSWS